GDRSLRQQILKQLVLKELRLELFAALTRILRTHFGYVLARAFRELLELGLDLRVRDGEFLLLGDGTEQQAGSDLALGARLQLLLHVTVERQRPASEELLQLLQLGAHRLALAL